MPFGAPELATISPKTALLLDGDSREMAMDALRNIVKHVPDWQKRLDDLAGQVEKRQAELAAVAAADPKNVETKSLRNVGSTESLKPKNEGPAQPVDVPDQEPSKPVSPNLVHPASPEEASAPSKAAACDGEEYTAARAGRSSPSQDVRRRQASKPSPRGGNSPPTAHRQIPDAAALYSRARANAKRRQRSASMISADAHASYRTRSMIIVYYDSHVQDFFDELVRFTSTSRNLMRKAKMAAKVAQIKRMAEEEVPQEEGDSDSPQFDLPSLRYMSSRRAGGMGPMSMYRLGHNTDKPDVYDTLDKGLEVVQRTCEHGAHQFLRDADCNDEINKIQKRLEEVYSTAKTEMERIEREEPELAKDTGDLGKVRTRRPASMRRELSLKPDDLIPSRNTVPEATGEGTNEAPNNSSMEVAEPLAVDTSMEADEGIEAFLPEIQYRSTRNMGYRTVDTSKMR